MAVRLSPGIVRALQALDAAEGKRLRYSDFRKATGFKSRAIYPLAQRMVDARLIARCGEYEDWGFELTFGGVRALAELEAA